MTNQVYSPTIVSRIMDYAEKILRKYGWQKGKAFYRFTVLENIKFVAQNTLLMSVTMSNLRNYNFVHVILLAFCEFTLNFP